MASSDLNLKIQVEVVEAIKDIRSLTEEVAKSQKEIQKNSTKASQAFSSFVGNVAANAATAALSSLKDAAVGLFDAFVVDGVKSAIEFESSLNSLTTAFIQTGLGGKAAAEEFAAYADELEAATAVGDDAILSAAGLLQQIGRLDNEGLKQATKSTLDLSAALGINLESAATLVGKAAQGNVTAFGKLGIEIKKGQTDAETFANTLQALAKFQGAAEAKTNTFAGSLALIRLGFDDFVKLIGNLIVKSPAVIGLFKGISQVIGAFTEQLKDGTKGQTFVDQLILSTLEFAKIANTFLIRPIVALADITRFAFEVIRAGFQGGIFIAAKFGEVLAELGNRFGLVSDDSLAFFQTLSESSKETFQQFDKNAKEALASIGTSDIADTLDQSLQVIGNSIRSQIERGVDEAQVVQKGVQKVNELDAALQGKVIQIAIQFGSNEALATQLAEQQVLLQQARDQQLLSEQEFQNAKLQLELEAENKRVEALTAAAIARETNNTTAYADSQENKLLIQQGVLQRELQNEQLTADQKILIQKRVADNDRKLLQLRLGYASQFFGDMSTLTQTGNRQLFEIGKAAALAGAIVDTARAVTLALGSTPPPFSYALAAAAAVRGAVQISTISAQKLATGLTEVPSGFGNDTFGPTFLTSGERVVSAPQNQDLKSFIERNDNVAGQLSPLLEAVVDRLDRLENQIIVNIGGSEIVNEMRAALRGGRTLSET